MHFDAITLACMAHELSHTIVPGRVQQVLLPSEQSVGLEVYAQRQRHYLLLSTKATGNRIQLCSQKLRRGVDTETPLLLLMRKYVRGGALLEIEQPDPTERVLYLRFEHPQQGPTTLVFEALGRFSNLLLLGPYDKIMDCIRRVRTSDKAARKLLPGQIYQLPPRQDKISPLDIEAETFVAQLSTQLQTSERLWKVLVSHIAGTSPTLAREIAWRAAQDIDVAAQAVDTTDVVRELQALWTSAQNAQWRPGVVYDRHPGHGQSLPIGFAPYEIQFRGVFAFTETLSQALEQADLSQLQKDDSSSATNSVPEEHPDAYANLRSNIAALLAKSQKRVQGQLRAIAGDEPAPGEPEALRLQAEWLLALHSQLEPDQEVLEVELGEEILRIALDPAKTPVEQAEQMFKKAAKLERAAKIIPERRAKLQVDLAFLEQLETDLSLAENQPELAAVQDELQRAGFLYHQGKKKTQTKGKSKKQTGQKQSSGGSVKVLHYLSPDGIGILVGRNARQNDAVTFKMATPSDLWLHVRGAPGSHVVIRSGGQPTSDETLQIAAQLAAYYSSLRGEKAAVVSVTQRRFVTRVPGGRPGQVYIRNEETVTVPATLPEEAMQGAAR